MAFFPADFVAASWVVTRCCQPPGMRFRNASALYRKPCVGALGIGLRLAVSDQRQQYRHDHEHDGSAEHPVRQVLVHDPAEQQRREDAGEVETGGDNAEGA